MINRNNFDLSAYFVVGPENTKNRPVPQMVQMAIESGVTCIQMRSKIASAQQLIDLTKEVAHIIKKTDNEDKVALLVNDRLDVILATRENGIKVDGIHVGQSDIPVNVCRKYLGDDAIIGLTTRVDELKSIILTDDVQHIDYFGVGPLRETATKPDCGQDEDGNLITIQPNQLEELTKISPLPLVVGGGVNLNDIPIIAKTGVNGFFVVSAISEAESPQKAAKSLVTAWQKHSEIIVQK